MINGMIKIFQLNVSQHETNDIEYCQIVWVELIIINNNKEFLYGAKSKRTQSTKHENAKNKHKNKNGYELGKA